MIDASPFSSRSGFWVLGLICSSILLSAGSTVRAASGEAPLDGLRDSAGLSGAWEVLAGNADAEVWTPDVAAALGPWQAVELPYGNLMPGVSRDVHEKTACVWLKRTVKLTEAQAARDGVLRWGGIRYGASAWVNGRFAGRNHTVGPNTIILPRGVLKPGDNELVLRVTGWGGIPMSAGGYPLITVGGGTQSWGGRGPAVYQDIWLEFYDDIYLKNILIMPEVESGQVALRIDADGVGLSNGPAVLYVDIFDADGEKVASTSSPMTGEAALVTLALEDVKQWTPASPYLYEARVCAVRNDNRICDDVRIAFGMRTLAIEDGRFRLNGRPLWLRGSNLVNEWLWGKKYNANIKRYLIDEARRMNLNVFRTHTQPPPTAWLDVADANGMMIMAEMPLLYNHADFGYTPEEYEILHRNAMIDAEAWITKLWNHPSVIMWVLSNESVHDTTWEAGPYYRFAKKLDPTRPCMRTGEPVVGTPDMTDVHTCFNVVREAEGQLIADMTELNARRDPARPLCNTEYMNRMWNPAGRFLGDEKARGMDLAYAMIATEHTEAMRRLGFDCLLPYMYAGWTGLRNDLPWGEDYPTPMAASLHSCMAPVLASLEVFDANYTAGRTIDVPVALINELHESVAATLDIYVTPRDPRFVPDPSALAVAVWHSSRDLLLSPDSIESMTVSVEVPSVEGSYYLAAVVRREGDRPVVSQRALRAVDPLKYAAQLKGRRVFLLGGDEAMRELLASLGCEVVEDYPGGRIEADVALVADSARLSHAQKLSNAQLLRDFAASGRRVAVLEQTHWDWGRLVDCTIGLPDYTFYNPVICSRAHAYEGATAHPVLRDIPADWLWRWNGLPGEIVNEVILEGPDVETGRKLLWASRNVYTALLSVPTGQGEILVSQLHMRRRLDPSGEAYDPVALRLLVNMLR